MLFLNFIYVTNPIIPNIINSIPDSFCIVFSGIFLPNNFPKVIAIESLIIIPKIAPAINATL